ncbi:MAG: sugar phosphate nucleotidyltransferase [Planctomycetota bacterium]
MRRDDVLCVVLGGGRGTRLDPLTRYRCKPAVPVGGKFRLVDIPISNSLNSSLRRIVVLTQFNSASLNAHIARTYRFDPFGGGFVHVLAAEQTHTDASWFQGTADAVRRSLVHIEPLRPRDVLILSGDQLYRMDFGPMLRAHRTTSAAVTVAAKPVPAAATPALGLLRVGEDARVTDFLEKPKDPALLRGYELPPGHRDPALSAEQYAASMGIYAFRLDALLECLSNTEHTDFGHDVLPEMVATADVRMFPFRGYWEDIGTIRAYYESSLELARPDPPFKFHQRGAPIFTEPRFLGASRVQRCTVEDSLLCDGCFLDAETIENSVVGIRAIVRHGSHIRRSIILGADSYEGEVPAPANAPPLGIGENCHIEGAIIDKNARIGDGVHITPKAPGTNEDGELCFVRDGVVVVPKNGIVPPGTVL